MFGKSINNRKTINNRKAINNRKSANTKGKNIKTPVKEMFHDKSGVSAIFGALLLIAILALFLSAFMLTAIPAKVMSEESAQNDKIFIDVLKLSDSMNSASFGSSSSSSASFSFYSKYTTIQATESAGGFFFAAIPEISTTPVTKSFLRSDHIFDPTGFPDFNDHFKDDLENEIVFNRLSLGALSFSSRYSQIPDRVYYLGDSSLLLIQEEGSSFLKPPSVFVRKGDGNILISITGNIIRTASSPVFGDLTTLHYRVIQKAEVYDFVTAVCIYYIPPEQNSLLNETVAAQKEESFRQWILTFENDLNRNFPELKMEVDIENLMIVIYSNAGFEIDITVREIEIILS
jgi:hypothetical protein